MEWLEAGMVSKLCLIPAEFHNSSSLALLSLLRSQMWIYTYLYIIIYTEGETVSW